jgi:hypothetical protein
VRGAIGCSTTDTSAPETAESVQRDRSLLPDLDALLRETGDAQIGALAEALGGGPLVALALDFPTWRRLATGG